LPALNRIAPRRVRAPRISPAVDGGFFDLTQEGQPRPLFNPAVAFAFLFTGAVVCRRAAGEANRVKKRTPCATRKFNV